MKRRTLLYKNLLIGMFLALFLLNNSAFSQTVITPGAGTTVSGGPNINITTTNIYNNFAVNSFSQLRADTDTNSVNFILPNPGAQVNLLINRISDPTGTILNTEINGILESTSQVGGTLLFASPAGIIIGNNANINVGSLILTTADVINCQAVNGFTMDVMQDSLLPTSGGIDSTLPMVFNKSSTSGAITNSGVINAGGNGTFAGAPANVTINALQFTNQAGGEIRIRDGVTMNDVTGGRVNVAIDGVMDYQLSSATISSPQEINFFPVLVNAGELSNAGLIDAKEGFVSLSSAASEIITGKVAQVRNETTGIIRTDALNANAPGGEIKLATADDSIFSNRSGNTFVQNDGLLSAKSSLTDMMFSGQGRIDLASDNISNEQPTSLIDVTGLASDQKAGEISLMPSFNGLNNDMQIGFDAPIGDSVHINNNFFTHVQTQNPLDSIINTPQIFIQSNNNATISNLTIPEGLGVLINTPNNLLVQAQITTGSSLDLSANNQMSIMPNIVANFDDTPAIMKYLRFQAPTINLDAAGNSDIILQSQNGNYPIVMRADVINNLTIPGNDIVNFDIGTNTGGQFVYQPNTTNHNMELNGTNIIVTTNLGLAVSTVDISNINLGTSLGALSLGDPMDTVASPFTGRINVTAIPVLPSLNDGSFLFFTMNSTPLINPVSISNCNFQANTQDVVIQTPFAGLNGDIDLSVNNNFDVLSLMTPQAVDIVDQADGIDIRFTTKTGYLNSVAVDTLNLSTPGGYNGNLSIEGDFNNVNAVNSGTGFVIFRELGNTVDINNLQTANGDIDLQVDANLFIPNTGTVSGNNVFISNNGFTLGDIVIDGTINASDAQLAIQQNNAGSSLTISNSANLQVAPATGPGRMELISNGTMTLDGSLNVIGRSNLPGQSSEIIIDAPTMTMSVATPPDIQITEQFEPYVPVVSIRTDNITNGNIPHAGPVISAYNMASMQHGALKVEPYTDGDLFVNAVGIDIQGGGQDILHSNVYLGASEGFLGVGSFGALFPGPMPPITYGQVFVTGKPANLFGSFDNATFAFNSQLVSNTIHPIVIQNSNFSNCNLFLNAPNATGTAGIDAATNNNFSNLTIMTEGTANITDLVNGFTIDYIEFNGGYFDSRAATLNALANGDVTARGDFDNVNLHAQLTGDILLDDHLGGVNIQQCLSDNNVVSIYSADFINILPSTVVEGDFVHIANVINPATGIPAGVIDVNGTVFARNGNVNIETSFGSVVFGATSNVQARQILLPDSGNILINRTDSSGPLNIDFQDGFAMSTISLPNSEDGYLEIADNLQATVVNVSGVEAGELSARSPYTVGTTLAGTTGNINVKLIEIFDGQAPEPEPEPEPTPIPDPTSDEPFTPEDSTPIIGDRVGEILLINRDTGEIISLTDNPETNNVVQIDLVDDTVTDDGFLDIESRTALFDGSSIADGEILPENDTIAFFSDSDDSTTNTDDSTVDPIDNTDPTLEDNTSTEGSDDQNNPEENGSSDDNPSKENARKSGSSILKAMENDEPVDVNDQKAMSAIFNICDGSGSCSDIDTPDNNILLDQAIFLNAQENEIIADLEGTKSLTLTGYHPSGLRGFLMTLEMIEKNTDNIQSKVGGNATPVFSYRHPKTENRIDKIKTLVENKNFMQTKNRRVRKKAYNAMIKGIQ